MRDEPAGDCRADRMDLVLQPCRDAKVAAAAPHGPEQIGMLFGAGPDDVAGGGDELDGAEVVDGEAVLAHQPAETAAEGEPTDTGRGHDAARAREPVKLSLAVVVAPRRAALSPRAARARVDVDRPHGGQIDHETTVADGVARNVVSAAADGDLEAPLSAEANRRLDVGGAVTAGHEGRPPIDQAIVYTPRVVVSRIRRRQHGTGDLRTQGIDWINFRRHRDTPHRRGTRTQDWVARSRRGSRMKDYAAGCSTPVSAFCTCACCADVVTVPNSSTKFGCVTPLSMKV
jgi:hypothetical protein